MLTERAGELGAKDAEIANLHGIIRSKDLLIHTLRNVCCVGDVAKITILPPGQKLPDISGDSRTLLEFLQARDYPMKLDDIAIGLMWDNSTVCENLAILRAAGLVELEDGEYEVI
jgi:hypothetical protein